MVSKRICFWKCSTHHSPIGKIGLWMPFMRSVHRREFDRISDKEYGLQNMWALSDLEPLAAAYNVVEDPILVSFCGEQLDPPASNISRSICRSLFTTNCRYSYKCRCFSPNFGEEGCGGKVADVVGYFELAICTRCFCMNNSMEISISK